MTEPSLPANDLASLQAYLARAALGAELPPELHGTRLAIYRRLVQGALDTCMLSILPRTAARLGDRFWREARRFYAERGPATHYLRDVPSEFLAWCRGRWPSLEDIPAYALDLAAHEVTAIEVGAALDGSARPAVAALSLEAPVVFQEATALRRYAHAVHLLPEEESDRSEPEARPVALLVYRDAAHELRYLELSPTAAFLLEGLLEGLTLQQAIVEGARRGEVRVADARLQGVAVLLGDLAERGALLGGVAPGV
ncbi:MAG: putative DNA-binding domain-containing protein [Polyangiaceae bacterium]|nr:putative DNA-binding domain-containing protein [Polyangiaceae bacterium]